MFNASIIYRSNSLSGCAPLEISCGEDLKISFIRHAKMFPPLQKIVNVKHWGYVKIQENLGEIDNMVVQL